MAAKKRKQECSDDVDQERDGEGRGLKELATEEFTEARSREGTQSTAERDGKNAEGGHTGRL